VRDGYEVRLRESPLRREIHSAYCGLEFVSEVRCLLLGKPRRSRAPAAQIRIGVSLMPRVWPRYLLNSSCHDVGEVRVVVEFEKGPLVEQ